MKKSIFTIILAAGFGAASMASSFSGNTVLTFETAHGKTIQIEVSPEAEAKEDTRVLSAPVQGHEAHSPGSLIDLQAVILELIKPEKEDPTPFHKE